MDVSRWERHEDFAVHPVGSKPKRTLICPADVPEPYLIPGHAYLFKTVKGWREQQVWSEVIAYRIAALVGVEVPPCFIAVDGDSGEVGNLVEFFYGYPGEAEPARFVHAVDLMRRFRAANAAGRPHAVRTNLRVCRAFRVPEPVEWWGRVLTFDALIGNTDRHLENWGFLVRRRRGERTTLTLAPAFDNGTSLGYEQGEERLRDACEPDWLNPYIERGNHHCGWEPTDDRAGSHLDLCRRYLAAYPQAGAVMRGVLQIEGAEIAEIADECTAFGLAIPFSADRARFITALLEARRTRVSAALGM